MLVLLPPSEGKTAPADGGPLDLDSLSFAELTAARERLLGKVIKLSRGAPRRALDDLGLAPSQARELAHNQALRTAPAGPAGEVYTGVLYERLRLPELPAAARARVLIASALWGVLRADDRIPAYRLSMAGRLRGIDGLAAFWRPLLRKALPDEGLILDLRSGPYASAWAPRAATVVALRAFTERDGRRAAVSHNVKAARGDVARLVLAAAEPPTNVEQVAAIVAAAGRDVELTRGRHGWALDVIERS